MNFNLIHFKHEDIETDVYQSSEDNSIWLRKEQMSLLFNKSTGAITQQIRKNSLSSTPSLAKMARQEDKNDELLYNCTEIQMGPEDRKNYMILPLS